MGCSAKCGFSEPGGPGLGVRPGHKAVRGKPVGSGEEASTQISAMLTIAAVIHHLGSSSPWHSQRTLLSLSLSLFTVSTPPPPTFPIPSSLLCYHASTINLISREVSGRHCERKANILIANQMAKFFHMKIPSAPKKVSETSLAHSLCRTDWIPYWGRG